MASIKIEEAQRPRKQHFAGVIARPDIIRHRQHLFLGLEATKAGKLWRLREDASTSLRRHTPRRGIAIS